MLWGLDQCYTKNKYVLSALKKCYEYYTHIMGNKDILWALNTCDAV